MWRTKGLGGGSALQAERWGLRLRQASDYRPLPGVIELMSFQDYGGKMGFTVCARHRTIVLAGRY